MEWNLLYYMCVLYMIYSMRTCYLITGCQHVVLTSTQCSPGNTATSSVFSSSVRKYSSSSISVPSESKCMVGWWSHFSNFSATLARISSRLAAQTAFLMFRVTSLTCARGRGNAKGHIINRYMANVTYGVCWLGNTHRMNNKLIWLQRETTTQQQQHQQHQRARGMKTATTSATWAPDEIFKPDTPQSTQKSLATARFTITLCPTPTCNMPLPS